MGNLLIQFNQLRWVIAMLLVLAMLVMTGICIADTATSIDPSGASIGAAGDIPAKEAGKASPPLRGDARGYRASPKASGHYTRASARSLTPRYPPHKRKWG